MFVQYLQECDKNQANLSRKNYYSATIGENQRLVDLINMPLHKLRLIAQVRLNHDRFFFRKNIHVFNDNQKCRFCNLNVCEDLFHFLFHCRIHESSRNIFLNEFLNQVVVTRENFKSKLTNMDEETCVKLSNYLVCSLLRRNLFTRLMEECST